MASSCNNFRSKHTNRQRVKKKANFTFSAQTIQNVCQFSGQVPFPKLNENNWKYYTYPVISYGLVCDAWSGWSINQCPEHDQGEVV